MPLSPNLRAALFMSVSMAGFTLNDALTKTVLAEMSIAQVMLVRGIFATSLIGLFAWYSGALASFGQLRRPLVAVRAGAEVGSTVAFLTALAHMPLANVSAILQALPLAVTMGAALFLSEPVGWRRWLAIGTGFTGVLIIVRPGLEGFNVFALAALLCVGFAAVRDLVTRQLPKDIPSLTVSFATSVFVTLAGGALVLPQGGFSAMTGGQLAILLAAAVLLVIGYQFIIMAMRTGEISFVAPFRYTALIFAIALGYFLLGEVPDAAMLVGGAIVVASGVYTLYRERKVGRMKPVATTTGPSMAPDGT